MVAAAANEHPGCVAVAVSLNRERRGMDVGVCEVACRLRRATDDDERVGRRGAPDNVHTGVDDDVRNGLADRAMRAE